LRGVAKAEGGVMSGAVVSRTVTVKLPAPASPSGSSTSPNPSSISCGKGQGGSQIDINLNGQHKEHTVEDTGGFQAWKDISIGEFEVPTPGRQRLTITPKSKAQKAILDIQKVVLKPVGE
jgi:hypothetical protein